MTVCGRGAHHRRVRDRLLGRCHRRRPPRRRARIAAWCSRTTGCSPGSRCTRTSRSVRARGKARAEVAAITERFLDVVGLRSFAGSYPHQLSGGMRQRVAIARVLANDAQVVLMDEPFGALDAMTRERLQDELLALWRSTALTVMFVTHAIEEAILLADRVVVMSPGSGRIVEDVAVALPRDVSSPEFNILRRALSALLHSGHGRGA